MALTCTRWALVAVRQALAGKGGTFLLALKDVWRAYRRQYTAVPCTFMHFTRIWRKDWRDCLKLR
eukprot:1708859-Lingulodinium_polyedra.AAC.1